MISGESDIWQGISVWKTYWIIKPHIQRVPWKYDCYLTDNLRDICMVFATFTDNLVSLFFFAPNDPF